MKNISLTTRGLFKTSLLAVSMLTAHPAVASPAILYRETFGYCSATLGKEAADQTGWMGLVSGHTKERISNLKVFSYGLSDIGGSVNSNPIGLAQGYTFWWKPVYGLAVLTTEFQFDVALLNSTSTTIEYRQRLSGVDVALQPNKTRLAIRVDDTWYISNEFVQQVRPGSWESAVVTPASLTYGVVTALDGVGPQTPESYASPLPLTGTVKAFGLFLDEVNGRVRFDNFMIKGEPPADGSIPTGVEDPDVSKCSPDSPDRSGGSQPTPTPDPDDGDGGVDHWMPDAPTPTPTPAITSTPQGVEQIQTVYQFCPVKEQGRGRKVVVPSKTRNALFKATPQTTLQDLRDRAVIAVLSQQSMPLGALVNVRFGDLNALSGAFTLSGRAAARPTKIKLRTVSRNALQAYLAHPDAPKDVAAPLFINTEVTSSRVITERALCSADLKVMLKARAQQARVSVAGVYTPRARR